MKEPFYEFQIARDTVRLFDTYLQIEQEGSRDSYYVLSKIQNIEIKHNYTKRNIELWINGETLLSFYDSDLEKVKKLISLIVEK